MATAADLRGLVPGMTWGLGSAEYVRRIRDESERDPDPTIADVPDGEVDEEGDPDVKSDPVEEGE